MTVESKDKVSILFSTMDFSICYSHQPDSGVHPASYPIRTWDSMPDGGSVAAKQEADRSLPSSDQLNHVAVKLISGAVWLTAEFRLRDIIFYANSYNKWPKLKKTPTGFLQ